jgi:hypothetical protein
MKAKFIVAAMIAAGTFCGCMKPRIAPYAEAAKTHAESVGNHKESGDQLKTDMIASLEPIKKKVKLTEGLLGATGAATTASGAAGTALTPVLTSDEDKKMIGYISSIVTTVAGAFQMVISKTDGAVEYSKAVKDAMLEWDGNPNKDKDAFARFLTKAEAIHDKHTRFATYTTPIDATTTDKKVKKKEIEEHR